MRTYPYVHPYVHMSIFIYDMICLCEIIICVITGCTLYSFILDVSFHFGPPCCQGTAAKVWPAVERSWEEGISLDDFFQRPGRWGGEAMVSS